MLSETKEQMYFGDTNGCVIDGDGRIILDYGVEINGGIIISVLVADEEAKLSLRFGESAAESSRAGP